MANFLVGTAFIALSGTCYYVLRRYPGNVLLVVVGIVSALVGAGFIFVSSL